MNNGKSNEVQGIIVCVYMKIARNGISTYTLSTQIHDYPNTKPTKF